MTVNLVFFFCFYYLKNRQIIVPGPPQDVHVKSINSTAIHVEWKPPEDKNRNGIIRGYHIHIQETKEEVNLQQRFKLTTTN